MMDTKCPYCAETIKSEAIVCPHCRRDLAFFRPVAQRLGKLEEKVDKLYEAVQILSQSRANAPLPPASNGQDNKRQEILGVIVATLLSVSFYAIYLWVLGTRPYTLWISIVSPLFVGVWLGYVNSNRSLRTYITVGFTNALIIAIGIAVCVAIKNANGPYRVDWGAVFRLYFLPPIFLITFGGFVGEWIRNFNNPQPPTPAYAQDLGTLFASLTNSKSENRTEQLSKFFTAITPFLVFLSSIISSWLTYVKTTGN